MLIDLSTFSGEIPKVSPRLLPPQNAQHSVNTKLWAGNLTPFRSPAPVSASLVSDVQSVYRMENAGVDYWLSWATDVDVAHGPISDTDQRIYYTGDGAPKKTDFSLATTGAGNYPIASMPMGVPRPTTAPTVTVSGSGTGPIETRFYLYTIVNDFDGVEEESAPSPASAVANWQSGQTVAITGFAAAPASPYNITKMRLYRTLTGTDATTFQFVEERAFSTASWSDAVADADLGEVLPSLYWDEPPSDMTGIISMPNGFLVGFSGRELCFSEVFHPHAWPQKYRLTVSDDIVAIAGYGTTIMVTTKEKPYLVEGPTPDQLLMSSPHIYYPCVSKRGLVDMGEMGIIYPTTDGLVSLSQVSGASLITDRIISLDNWRALNPSSIKAYRYDNRYFFSWTLTDGSGGSQFLDMDEQQAFLVNTDYHPTNGWFDLKTGKLYLIIDSSLYEWDPIESTYLVQDWWSKVFVSPVPVNLGVAMVEASFEMSVEQTATLDAARAAAIAYNEALLSGLTDDLGSIEAAAINEIDINGDIFEPIPRSGDRVSFYLYVDGVLRYQRYITDSFPFKLPRGFLGTRFEARVSGNVRVDRIKLAETIKELMQ